MPSKGEQSESEFKWDTDCSRSCNCSSNSGSSWIDNKNDEISENNEENFLQFDNCEDNVLWTIDNIEQNEDDDNKHFLIGFESDCVDGSNQFNDSKPTEEILIRPQLVITEKRSKHKLVSDIKDKLLLKNMKK